MAGKAFLALDSSIKDNKDYRESIRLDVEYNRIAFEFPEGFTTIPLLEECRALNNLENFDFMYDIVMQMLVGKPVFIILKDYKDGRHVVDKFLVTDRRMDLRGVDFINQYPIVVNWLTDFVAEYLRKKFPRPLEKELLPTTSETKKKTKKQKLKDPA
jgi:hypothetical protein